MTKSLSEALEKIRPVQNSKYCASCDTFNRVLAVAKELAKVNKKLSDFWFDASKHEDACPMCMCDTDEPDRDDGHDIECEIANAHDVEQVCLKILEGK